MGRKHDRNDRGPAPLPEPWELERSLAAAEADEAEAEGEAGDSSDATCPCGSEELLLQAYLQVVAGKPSPVPVEVETLTCPQCGREFEAVLTEDGRVLRGEFIGYVEMDE